jgi:cytidylate kinase
MPVITIGRQFGAGGESIAQLVAQRLSLDLVDRKIFDEVVRRLELPPAEVERHEETPGTLLGRLLTALSSASLEVAAPHEPAAWTPPYGELTGDTRQAVLRITQEVIWEAGRSGGAVIVGRGAGHLLRDHPRALHVFIHADEEARIARVCELHGWCQAEARRGIKQVDANRAAYVKQVYGHDWMKPCHYHLMLDSGRLGYARSAEAIIAAARSLP